MVEFENFKKTVVGFIANHSGIDGDTVAQTDNFVTAGFLDSVSMIELVLFLEEKFEDIHKDFDFDVLELGTFEGLYKLFEQN